MMKLSTREAIIGIVAYRVLKLVTRRMLLRKGGMMATKKKKTALLAAIGALIGALFFWRKRKTRQSEL